MHTSPKIRVVILNGFLGSGKTTLFRSLLSQALNKGISVCAIVNDMSALDIDGELISNTEMVEENESIFASIPACVLSSEKGIGALNDALNGLLANQTPELVIIETSGSTHPLPLVEYLQRQSQVTLIGLFALVDSLMLAHDYDYGQNLISRMQQNMAQGQRDTTNLLVEQILFCSHLFFTKADRLGEGKLEEIAASIQSINPSVPAHSVRFGNLPIESLFALPEYDYFKVAQLVKELKPLLASETQHQQPYNLVTRVIQDDRPFHPQRLWTVCRQYLGDKVYRSKGFFWLASRGGHALLWNQAAGDINLEINGTWRSSVIEDPNNGLTQIEIEDLKQKVAQYSGRFGDRHCDLTVIGDKTQVDEFTNALKSCFLTDAEIQQWFAGQPFEDPWPKNIMIVKHSKS
ncbi:MAG: GTP-binding protein [Thiotrichales bacterium]|nr:GTP-binding protein [Thiotrichales bacterium]